MPLPGLNGCQVIGVQQGDVLRPVFTGDGQAGDAAFRRHVMIAWSLWLLHRPSLGITATTSCLVLLMDRKHPKLAICHVCGKRRPMSLEHVPPRRCGNSQQTWAYDIDDFPLISDWKATAPIKRTYRSGMGKNTLCKPCNESTGGNYGDAFFAFWQQTVAQTDTRPSDSGPFKPVTFSYTIEPLTVLKQIAVMALAVGKLGTKKTAHSLMEFARNQLNRAVDPFFRFALYLNPVDHSPLWVEGDPVDGPPSYVPQNVMSGWNASIGLNGTCSMMFSHIAFPPLGYVVTMAAPKELGPLPPVHTAMADITSWQHYGWGQTVTLSLTLPVYRPVGPARFHGLEDEPDEQSSVDVETLKARIKAMRSQA